MTQKIISVAYHSGYGHTKKQAEALAQGVIDGGAQVNIIDITSIKDMQDPAWKILADSTAIVFGSPTYMGSVSAQFKTFLDMSSKVWYTQDWKNKIAGGFTNSASLNGDKQSTMQYLMTFAMQHSMIWVGTGLMPSSMKDSTRDDINSLGGMSGALAASPADSTPEEAPGKGDLETARLYGMRIAQTANALHEF
jgi:NAD(P)H dehydrogenase (quinone)